MLGKYDCVLDSLCTQQIGDVMRIVQPIAVLRDRGRDASDELPGCRSKVVGAIGVRVEINQLHGRGYDGRAGARWASRLSSARKNWPMRRALAPRSAMPL